MFIPSFNARRSTPVLLFLFSVALILILLSFYYFAVPTGLLEVWNDYQEPQRHFNTDDPVSACFVILVRNSELDGIKSSIDQMEKTFNHKYNYPYVFLNDDDFSAEFIENTKSLGTAEKFYGKLDEQMWGYPKFINQSFAAERRKEMVETQVPYADSESYRHMCRFQSGFFFRHPLLDKYDYYWRIEPNVDFLCDIDYDVFKFMRNNGKKYAFTLTFVEFMKTIPSLWDTVLNFRREHPEIVSQFPPKEKSLWKFITDDDGESYNSCHFWTNFEIASLDLWRSSEYLKFFNYLDESGGFFYERWGDAPVHSIAAAMLLRKDEFHFFHDMGYRHTDVLHCPADEQVLQKCSCNHDSFVWDDYEKGSCLKQYNRALLD
ncbi:nucleotide-diphospho-sugar transferase [Zychaea mexicana]|uniref:nucleotide-diphospho-sugar transferase n=1 Tax=Zychaea mexicana TaxID=64656 RepID=UPI0022FF1BD6|nr:nucleotide-diphospho-sugar transferase [Zychaea mexicana]KAI9490735.1 nucleotide-diphospho-sugar transferase [Zychaea mexicana]